MKKLLITLLLISPFSFADWGDVYYCEETSSSITFPDGGRETFPLRKFQFKLDETQNAMVFGEDSAFAREVVQLISYHKLPEAEHWAADKGHKHFTYNAGDFMYANVDHFLLSSGTAKCVKF